MTEKLKILFVPFDAIGYVNPCIGLAQVFIECGHSVTFIINEQWRGRLVEYGIEEILLKEDNRPQDEDPAKYHADLNINHGILKECTPLGNALDLFNKQSEWRFEISLIADMKVDEVLKIFRPDVIFVNQDLTLPTVVKSGIPWVLVCSSNPLYYINDERTPPPNSGLPAVNAEKEWKEFRKLFNEVTEEGFSQYSDFLEAIGLERLKPNKRVCINDSKWLNVYGFPEELDYTDLRPLPPNWYRFDNFMRSEKQSDFEIPVELREKSGKLIYFSFGSYCAADMALMKRLIAILAKSKHRFIVSKGQFDDRYELSDNMWGQSYLPQTAILPVVDLVILHGGNNTLTETFYFGKPMIVLPICGDTWDNAQRIHEKGFGLRLDPYNCSEEELLNGIENLLNDKKLNERLKTISKRIQSENSLKKIVKLIEELVHRKQCLSYT